MCALQCDTPKRYDNITCTKMNDKSDQIAIQNKQSYTLKGTKSGCVINFFLRPPKKYTGSTENKNVLKSNSHI
jgi:hypothetical protein